MTRTPPYDVIVVGSGAAGCVAALSLAPLKVALVTAGQIKGDCSSYRTQGGLAAAVGKGDSPEKHSKDTCLAGAEIVDKSTADQYSASAGDIVRYLEMNGVQFDRNHNKYVLSREGGHSVNRVLKSVSGDGFGRALMPVLWEKTLGASHIDIIDRAQVRELVKTADGRIGGIVYSRPRRVENKNLSARAVILATGGAAGLYAQSTNPLSNTGAALALCYRAGAALADLEFMQFHPTAMDTGKSGTLPLLTEALRGQGALLVNDRGERFMTHVHPMAELAPRDIVARAITGQQALGPRVYLDCRNIDFSSFEALKASARAAGLDPAADLLPVTPAAHYHMGGAATDQAGRTSLKGLWVIGEAASTGFHGANRLASNSILEAVTMGRLSAQDVKSRWAGLGKGTAQRMAPVRVKNAACLNPVLKRKLAEAMRRAMSENVGIVRDEQNLSEAVDFFEDIIREYQGLDHDLEDMALACLLISRAALARRESRGGHYRTDYPERDAQWRHRSFINTVDIKAEEEFA